MFSIIVAFDKNFCIGANGDLPWHIKQDLRHFKELTMGHKVVFGRKTFDSIKKELPGRVVYVATKTRRKAGKPYLVIRDFGKFLEENKNSDEEIFIAGGEQIYKMALPYVKKLYITQIDLEVQGGDAFFPKIENLKIISKKDCEENGVKFSFLECEREIAKNCDTGTKTKL